MLFGHFRSVEFGVYYTYLLDNRMTAVEAESTTAHI